MTTLPWRDRSRNGRKIFSSKLLSRAILIAAFTLSLIIVPLCNSRFSIESATGSKVEKVVFLHFGKKAHGNDSSSLSKQCSEGSNEYNLMSSRPRWEQFPVPFHVDTSAFPLETGDLSANEARAAVESAFNTWDSADHPDKQMFFRSSEPSSARIIVSWGSIDGPENILARTSVIYLTETKELVSASIEFDKDDSWFIGQPNSCGASGSSFDIESVAAHEIGHSIGLDHVKSAGLTMYPFTLPGDTLKRTLGAGDGRGLNKLY